MDRYESLFEKLHDEQFIREMLDDVIKNYCKYESVALRDKGIFEAIFPLFLERLEFEEGFKR